MNLWIDIKYAKLAGSSIGLFKLKSLDPFLAYGRCPICGDSKTNKYKCRFYFYQKESKINAQCHNCGYSASLGSFLKLQEPDLFKQYCFEVFGEKSAPSKKEISYEDLIPTYERTFGLTINNSGLPLVSSLPDTHPAKIYIKERKLPDYDFLYAEKFIEFAEKFNPEFTGKKEHARIIIPFFTESREIHAFQGRSLGNENPKYYTCSVTEESHKIFGIENVDKNKDILVVEGPLDSLFLHNCIAARSSSLKQCAEKSASMIYNNPRNDYVLVFDNEPRNKDLCKIIKKSIDEGFRVCLMPDNWLHKDINDAILAGVPPNDILHVIKKNTYQGLYANLQFNKWKKC